MEAFDDKKLDNLKFFGLIRSKKVNIPSTVFVFLYSYCYHKKFT